MGNLENNILEFFPRRIASLIKDKLGDAEEIRIRQARNIFIKNSMGNYEIEYLVNCNDILEIMQKICEYSIYSYQNQISHGFITVKGGHRVGLTGSCVIENGKVINIKYINSLNFRIARQVFGAGDNVLDEVIDGNKILNSIIVSPPGYGKTTILKDIIRNLSSGIKRINFDAVDVGVVDERGELSAMYKGVPQNDLGIKVDIIENTSKEIGIKMLVRSMSPKVIVVDEIGTKEDIKAINYAFCSGVKGIFSCHGESYNDLIRNPIIKDILDLNIINKVIILSEERGKIKDVVNLNQQCSIM